MGRMDGAIGKSRVKDGWRDEKDETLGKNKVMKG